MDDYMKEALEIVKAQAGVRTMTEDEIVSMTQKLSGAFKGIMDGSMPVSGESEAPACDPAKAIKERSVTCCVCGKSFKIITKKHLASHGLTPEEYREQFGLKKGTPLVCKSLQRERRKKMSEMRLWTLRDKKDK